MQINDKKNKGSYKNLQKNAKVALAVGAALVGGPVMAVGYGANIITKSDKTGDLLRDMRRMIL